MNKLTCKISKTEETLMWIIDLTPLDADELVDVTTSLVKEFNLILESKPKDHENEIVEECVEKKKFCCVFRQGNIKRCNPLETSSRKRLAELSIQIVDLH